VFAHDDDRLRVDRTSIRGAGSQVNEVRVRESLLATPFHPAWRIRRGQQGYDLPGDASIALCRAAAGLP
jgi:hypothetical protein